MGQYEQDDYHAERHPELIESRELRRAWAHFADHVYFSKVNTGERILEFGGGLGNNLLQVKERSTVCMVELGPKAREIAASDGVRSVAALSELGSEVFDYVLCRHVLEHVDNPKQILEQLRGRLTNSGRLILVLPCERGTAMPVVHDLDHHLYCWNPRTISNLLSASGFSVTDIRFEYYGARRRLLPVCRFCGGLTYAKSVRLVGRIFRFRELVVEAVPSTERRRD